MTRSCIHCHAPFEPKKCHQTYCSKACQVQYWNRNWKDIHPHPNEHHAWRDMRRRCNNPNHEDYPRYGARGISVCAQWGNFDTFFADMGPKPGKSYSIERKDNDGNYEPTNCKWATKKEQGSNRRCCWTSEQDASLRRALASGLNLTQAGRLIGKSPGSTCARAHRIGLETNWDPHAPRKAYLAELRSHPPHVRQGE